MSETQAWLLLSILTTNVPDARAAKYNTFTIPMMLLFSSLLQQATYPACTQAQKASVLSPTSTQVEVGLVRGHCSFGACTEQTILPAR